MAGTLKRIPHYIAASSPKGLMRLMFENNLKHGIEFEYFSIQFDGSSWVAWYRKELHVKLKAGQKRVKAEADGT